MYKYEVKAKLANKLKKFAKKDRFYYELLVKKILQIAENPGKPLRNVLKGKRRIHIDPFVLIYEINENEHKIIFFDFEHHDTAYK